LQAALRKAPQTLAVGFRQCVHKLNVVVQLLLGELPDRGLFRQPFLKTSLHPYFQVTQAVRLGNLGQFNEALETYSSRFRADGTYTLILRLRHNVIKTGIRLISLSYSKIALHDIAQKLALDNPDDVEFIVAKAIRDRVIDASINHEKGYVQTNDTLDIYSTAEPFHQLNQRINFCLNIRNQSVKAMRYPEKYVHDNDEESAEERREREMLELETAKEMSEEDFDGF
jgi:26S proteasome regulatory subunit N3